MTPCDTLSNPLNITALVTRIRKIGGQLILCAFLIKALEEIRKNLGYSPTRGANAANE